MPSATETNLSEPGRGRLLDIAEAAEYLHVPYTWLQAKVTQREVPHTRIGKHVRFTQEHLARIVADGEQPVEGAKPRKTAHRTRL